jgi:hypothetical protein
MDDLASIMQAMNVFFTASKAFELRTTIPETYSGSHIF